jgi:hypothetical protein
MSFGSARQGPREGCRLHLMEICKVHQRSAFKMCIRVLHPRSASGHCRLRTKAFLSESVSADCTLRHVPRLSHLFRASEVTLSHVSESLLMNLVMNCKHLASGLRAPISMVRVFAPTPLLQSSYWNLGSEARFVFLIGKWHWHVEGRFMTYRHCTEQTSQGK